MKTTILTFLFLLVLISSCTQQSEITVMTWNIWHGGIHGNQDSNYEKDTSNTTNTLQVILENDPDVLFMQETYCCGMEIAKAAGYKYSWRGSSNLSIHCKYPIVDTLRLFRPFFSHGVVIDVKGQKVMCFNIWLRHLPAYFMNIKTQSADSLILGEADTRLFEITSILHAIDSLVECFDDMPVIVGGDFNSGSHLDWIESTQKNHYNKIVEWPVSKKMNVSGFRDSYREIQPDPLTHPGGTFGYTSDNIITDRIDYIYFKGNLKPIESSVINNDPQQGFFNSDHRAVLTKFQY